MSNENSNSRYLNRFLSIGSTVSSKLSQSSGIGTLTSSILGSTSNVNGANNENNVENSNVQEQISSANVNSNGANESNFVLKNDHDNILMNKTIAKISFYLFR